MCTTVPGENFCSLVRTKINSISLHPRSRSLSGLLALPEMVHVKKFTNFSKMQLFHPCCCEDLHSKISHRCHFIWFISDKNVKFEIKCFRTSFSICLVQTCDNIWVYLSLSVCGGCGGEKSEKSSRREMEGCITGTSSGKWLYYKTHWNCVVMRTPNPNVYMLELVEY